MKHTALNPIKYQKLAVHKWIVNAKITESVGHRNYDGISYRRFTATICGFRNWKIAEGGASETLIAFVVEQVQKIRDRIENGDQAVFNRPNKWQWIVG